MKPLTYAYIAGPYRARSGAHDVSVYDEIDANIQVARKAAIYLAEHNVPYFCPHLNSAHMEVHAPSVSPEFWLDMDFLFLDNASAIYLLPRWEESQGAGAEYRRGQELGIATFGPLNGEQLVSWWRSQEAGGN